LAWTWNAGFQNFSGWRCWQVKKPVSGASGSDANASENATLIGVPSGRFASRSNS
jgi:hypothetical protein